MMGERPSAWIAGFGVGLGATCLLGIAAELRGWAVPILVYAEVVGLGMGLVLALDFAGRSFVSGMFTVLEVVRNAQTLAPAPTLVQADQPKPEPDTDLLASAWKVPLSRFFRAGDSAGSFSIRNLAGVVSEGDWAALTDFYCSDEGRRVLRDRGGNLGTAWGYGWSLDAVLQALNASKLPLPDMPVPDVQPYVGNTTQRNTKKRAPAVVEHQKG
jgi:hypothetical protein